MRKRGNVLPVSDDEGQQRSRSSSPIKNHLKKKRQLQLPKGLTKKSLGILIPALYLAFRWTSQFIDYVYDGYHYKEMQRQTAKFPLYYDIPYIPSSNWPVWSRWFRPHDAHIKYNAKLALQEYGDDLRKLMERGKHPLTYDSHISNRDDPELRHWCVNEAAFMWRLL
jgi:hypothetical protein